MAAPPVIPPRSYQITDAEHLMNILVALITWMFALIFCVWFCTFLLSSLSDHYYWGAFLGMALWIWGVGESIEMFVVSVPEVTGLITVNMLKSVTVDDPYANQRVYPVGFWFKLPSEQVKRGLFMNLRIVSQEFEEDFPAFDGPKIETHGGFIYRPHLPMLPRYIAADDTVINLGLVNITTSTLMKMISALPAREARREENVNRYQETLVNVFSDPSTALRMADAKEVVLLGNMGLDPSFENLFGIDFIAVQVADADYEAHYQTSLSQQARAKLIDEVMQNLTTERGLQAKEAANTALLQFGIVTKNIFEVEGAADIINTLISRFGRS